MQEKLTPPVQTGLHLTVSDGQFVIAVTVRNPTDEPITLTSSTTRLMSVSLAEDGLGEIWRPGTGAGMAQSSWTLSPGERVTRHYSVPDSEQARTRGEELLAETGDFLYDESEDPEVVVVLPGEDPSQDDYDHPVHFEPAVEPDNAGVITVEATLPTIQDISPTITRRFDLRHNQTRTLDNDIPDETSEGLERRGVGTTVGDVSGSIYAVGQYSSKQEDTDDTEK